MIRAAVSSDEAVNTQAGPCHIEMWTVVNGKQQGPSRFLGVGRWEDLLELVDRLHGRRWTYDLFDIPQPDGSIQRYRAVDVEAAV